MIRYLLSANYTGSSAAEQGRKILIRQSQNAKQGVLTKG